MMNKRAQAAYNELKSLGAPVFERSDIEHFAISGEDDNSYEWADYDNFMMGEFGIATQANEIAAKYGLFFEWETAGCAIAHDA